MIYVFASKAEKEQLKDYIEDKNAKIIITGMGFGNVINALKDVDRNETIVNIGYCGSNNIPVDTVCSVKECFYYHPFAGRLNKEFERKLKPNPKYKIVDCYTSGDFVVSCDKKEPIVFDMELFAICSFGFEVEAIKIVSDNLLLHDYEHKTYGD